MRGKFKQVSSGKYRHIIDLPRGADGKRRQKTFTYLGDRRTAERKAAETVLRIAGGAYVAEATTLASLMERFLSSSRAKGRLGAKTHERYAEIARVHILPSLGSVVLEKLSPGHIEAFYTRLLTTGRKDGKGGGLSPRTVLHIHRLLRRALQLGVKWQMVQRNVADAVEPPVPKRTEMKVLDVAELQRLLDAAQHPTPHCKRGGSMQCDPSFYSAVKFMVDTGARRGECLAMRWEDINLETGVVSIRRSLEETKDGLAFKAPKNGRTRNIAIGKSGIKVLKAHRARQAEDRLALGPAYASGDLVFARRDGTPYAPSAFGNAFRALVRRTNIPQIRLHDIRHTHASLLGKSNVPLKVVSERLGHSSIGITADTYTHQYPSQDAAAVAAFDALLEPDNCDTDVIRRGETG